MAIILLSILAYTSSTPGLIFALLTNKLASKHIFDIILLSIRQNESFERTNLILTSTPLIKKIYLNWKRRSEDDLWDLAHDFLECIASVSRASYLDLTSLMCPCNREYPRPISKKLDRKFLRVKHNLILILTSRCTCGKRKHCLMTTRAIFD